MDKPTESNTMTDNVIKFPNKLEEKVEVITDELDLHRQSLSFAYEAIDNIHDMLHEETGDCIYTDDDYTSITIFIAEVISGMFLMSHGVEHPMQEIADDLFNDVDISDEMDYSESNDETNKDT